MRKKNMFIKEQNEIEKELILLKARSIKIYHGNIDLVISNNLENIVSDSVK
jgi:hypothetical protein